MESSFQVKKLGPDVSSSLQKSREVLQWEGCAGRPNRLCKALQCARICRWLQASFVIRIKSHARANPKYEVRQV
ncbi:hypothetical protein J6590_074674 [Homalodisca vitripennis]|nr:hypothetical protein J6590_074674 [Homalodisca vitripennis]